MATLAEQIKEWYQLYQVNKDGYNIIRMKSPSEKVQLAAVNQNPDAILHIEKPSEEVQLAAVQQNGNYIQTISNPSERVQLAAVNQHGYFIEAIDNPSERVQMVAIEEDLANITLIDSPCEAAQIYAVKHDPFVLSLIPTAEAVRILAVEQKPSVILHIENPSPALCKAAIEAEFPGTKINHADQFITKELFKRIETTGQKQSYEALENELLLQTQNRIEAIQVLQGNAPEQILEERFSDVREEFSCEMDAYFETLYDVETDRAYSGTRMMSDNIFEKNDIQKKGKWVAEVIKDTLRPEESLKFAEEIATASNLPLGKTPTIEETLSLFSNQFCLKQFTSSVFENERTGQYEFQSPSAKYQQRASELLHAGTHPYSPNYKEVFEKAGLKEEFNNFEKACCARSQWNDAYNYSIITHDIANIGDLERELPTLDEKIENSRELAYNKLSTFLETNNRHQSENHVSQETIQDITSALSEYKESTENLITGLNTKKSTATPAELKQIDTLVIALNNPQTAFAIGAKADQYIPVFKALGVEKQFTDFREKWERLNQLCELSSDSNIANLSPSEKKAILKEFVAADDAFEKSTMELITAMQIKEKALATPVLLSTQEQETLIKTQRSGRLPNDAEFIHKFGFDSEKIEYDSLDRNENGYFDTPSLYNQETKVSMKAGYILEENGILPKGSTKEQLIQEGWKVDFLDEVESNIKYSTTNENISLADNYKILGYDSIATSISEYAPNYNHIITSGSSSIYKIENVNVTTAGSKTLIGDISISQVDGKAATALENLHIKDKSTGLTEPLKTNGIDLSREPADTVKKLLSGSKVQTSSAGITQMLGLSKTPLGWGITIGKQVFNSTDSSAGIG